MGESKLYAADFSNGYTYIGKSKNGILVNTLFLEYYVMVPTRDLISSYGSFDRVKAKKIYEGIPDKMRWSEITGSMVLHHLD